MAEEERIWAQRHAHESTTISYGQFGTPIYQESSQSWEFPRKDGVTEIQNGNATKQEDNQARLNILTIPKVVIEPANIKLSNLQTGRSLAQVKRSPDLAAASSLIKTVGKEKAVSLLSHQGNRIAFGSALWLSADGVDSGNLVVPIVAYTTGLGADTLCLACLGQERFPYSTEDESARDFRVPSLIGDPQVSCSGTEPILQVSFSQRNIDWHGDTFLLVRRASQTSIFEPLLHRGTFFHAQGEKSSSLDPNLLVTLHTSITGGHRHVDSTFHPFDHRKIAIIDEEGNWSIWKIRGRRSTTARILYQARLRASGKVFSWKLRKRSEGVGLFFDGWHKVLWTSSDGHEIDRLLVCNRQMIKLFTLTGQELLSVDPRLDLGKASYVLDIQSGPRINLCFILTTSKLLVFDMAQKEWKDPASGKGPALLCAFQHFQNPAGLSLKMTDVRWKDELLLALYSTDLHSLSVRQLTLTRIDGKTSVTVSDTRSISLPIQAWKGQVTGVILARSEMTRQGEHLPYSQQELVRVITQYEDLSVYSFWATAKTSNPSGKSVMSQPLLKCPPNRSLQRKSGLRVDDSEDEDDVDGFIVSDTDEEDDVPDEINIFPQSSPTTAFGRLKLMRHVDEMYAALREQGSGNLSRSTMSTHEVSQKLESRLQDVTSDKILSSCLLLSDLIEDDARIGDVEAESNGLQRTISNSDRNATNRTITLCHGSSAETLLGIYNKMFNTFVEGLPSDVPDRSRVQKERQYRSLALEQYLSSYTVRSMPGEMKAAPGKTQAVSEASQTIFSDPLQHNDLESQHFQSVSASQPLPRTRSEPSKPSIVPSPVLDSLSQLQSYTRITRGLDEILTDDQETLSRLSYVLSHLPISCEENPEDYDYQSTMMASAAEKAAVDGQDMQAGGRAQRKANGLARARRRAENLSSGIQGGKPNLHSVTADKEPGNINRGVDSSGQRSQDRDARSLPIRSSGETFPGLAWRDSVAQTQQHPYHVSDGHVPAESSSQAAVRENMTLTQPERGTFANRADGKGYDRAKKKKKRIAGF